MGVSVMNMLVGIVQDHTPGKAYTGKLVYSLHSMNDDFGAMCAHLSFVSIGVMILNIGTTCLALLLSAILSLSQRLYLRNVLEVGQKKRQQRMNDVRNEQLLLIRGGQISTASHVMV
jgi:heme exporter protein D